MKVYLYRKDTLVFSHMLMVSMNLFAENINEGYDFTLTPPPDYKNQCRWVDDRWVIVPESLESQQAKQWDSLKNERSNKISSGVLVESTGKVFQTDNHSLTQYANIAGMIALDNYEPIEWKTTDNSFVLLTVDVFKELQQAINSQTQDAFKEAERKRVADNTAE